MRRAALALLALAFVPLASARPGGGDIVAFVSDEHADRLVVVQPITGALRKRIPVARGPHNVAATPDGRLVLVTSPPAGKVTIVRSGSLRAVKVLGGFASPHDVEVSPDGRWAYVTEEQGDRVAAIDLRALRVVRRVRVADAPHDLAVSPSGWRTWVTHGRRTTQLTILDTSLPRDRLRVLRRVPSGRGAPHDISWSRSAGVWVTYWSSGAVGRYAPSGRLEGVVSGGTLAHHVLATDQTVWISDHRGARVFVRAPSGRVLRSFRVAPDPHHVAVAAGVAVVVSTNGVLTAFREETGERIGAVRVGEHLHGGALVFNP